MEAKLMLPAMTCGRYVMTPEVGYKSIPTEELPIEAIWLFGGRGDSVG